MYRKILQTSVAAAALFAFAGAYSAPASADNHLMKSGQKGASLTFSGQVHRAVMFVDDGTDSSIFHADNSTSSSRVRWVGKGKVTDNVTVGMVTEWEIESNPSSKITIAGHEDTSNKATFGERKTDIFMSHKNLGKLSIGRGDPASNGSAEVNMSQAGSAANALITGPRGILFREAGDTAVATGPPIGKVWSHHDGQSRINRIRYDTPKFQGFVASVAHMQGDAWDIALRHAGKFGQFKTSAAIAYVNLSQRSGTPTASNDDTDTVFDGSFGVLHDSGFNVSFSAGVRESKDPTKNDDDHWWVQVGYIAKFTDIGTTRFAVDYGNANDVQNNGDEFTTYAVAVVQNLKDIGTDIYAVVRNNELDRTAKSFDDITSFIVGAKVKF